MMSGDGFSSPPSSLTSFIHDPIPNPNPNPNSSASGKRKRNQAGNPDPDAEVIALSPTSLMATNRFVCEICNKGFQRDQNLQLHRRGHNLPWKLKQRNKNEVIKKKVYICPEKSCVHHDPSRALGDLTGVKKHFSRKHGEKKWKCEKCSKKYAVQSDWKAHSKICDHNANNPHLENPNNSTFLGSSSSNYSNSGMLPSEMVNWLSRYNGLPQGLSLKEEEENQKEMQMNSMYNYGGSTTQNNLLCSTLPPPPVANMSATALLQKAAQMGSTRSTNAGVSGGNDTGFGLMSTTLSSLSSPARNGDRLMMMTAAADGSTPNKVAGGNEFGDGDLTRDFLGGARNERSHVSFNLQQELSKFASSTMGFSQFNRNRE
ncbi:Zinc finger, C2H2 [Cynara cardunculus var. scolymus]|uniref:Zinc finger, C2H2 n=1 Tax=Cynara cardunculus var. scolymus TaxID=59895 RepID=A0A103Y0H7_CYNCS|nr:Zinc finger, C2H2 [Cynara cardunculus var. scolymus]